jgi:hypothetical protein
MIELDDVEGGTAVLLERLRGRIQRYVVVTEPQQERMALPLRHPNPFSGVDLTYELWREPEPEVRLVSIGWGRRRRGRERGPAPHLVGCAGRGATPLAVVLSVKQVGGGRRASHESAADDGLDPALDSLRPPPAGGSAPTGASHAEEHLSLRRPARPPRVEVGAMPLSDRMRTDLANPGPVVARNESGRRCALSETDRSSVLTIAFRPKRLFRFAWKEWCAERAGVESLLRHLVRAILHPLTRDAGAPRA